MSGNNKTYNPALDPVEQQPPALPLFQNIPNGPLTNYAIMTIAGSQQLGELKDRIETTAHGKTMTQITKDDSKRTVKYESDRTGWVSVEIGNIEEMAAANITVKKILTFALAKFSEQVTVNDDGTTSKPTICFSLSELVDENCYKSIESARKGVKLGLERLQGIRLSGELKQGKTVIKTESAVPFPYFKIEKNFVVVDLNPRLNWNAVTPYYTILPKNIYGLPSRAFDLCLYIFSIARQRTDEIAKNGGFNISIKSIWARLNLPSPEGNNKPYQLIKKPIEDAIVAIEDTFKTTDFTIEQDPRTFDAPINEFMSGYIRITLKGEYARRFIELHKVTQKKRQQRIAKQEKIVADAKAKNLAKKMEIEEAAQNSGK